MRLSSELLTKLIKEVMELQISQKQKPTIMFVLTENYKLTDYQAEAVYRKAVEAWADSENINGKTRYVASLARLMEKAEMRAQYATALRALELIGKVDGHFEKDNVQKATGKTFDEDRLEELLRELEKDG